MAGDLNTDREVAANVRFTEILPLRKTGHTSKGDQLKWKSEKKWYKADYMGYEGLAEVLVSHLLQKSTMRHPFVLYEPVQIEYGGTVYQGCSSMDFLSENQIMIPLESCLLMNAAVRGCVHDTLPAAGSRCRAAKIFSPPAA